MDKERFLELLAESLSAPLPLGYGVELDDQSAHQPPPAVREKNLRRLVAEGRIAIEESSSYRSDASRWVSLATRRIRRIDPSLPDEAVDALLDTGPGSGLWFTKKDERKWRCGCGDYVDGLALIWNPESKSVQWQEYVARDDRLMAASVNALQTLQTFLRNELHDSWPAADGASVPKPGAKIEDGVLTLWFGYPEDPVLIFPEIHLG